MEKSSRRNSSYDSRPISTATQDAGQYSMDAEEKDDIRPISTSTAATPPITVLRDDELARVRRALGATRPRPYYSSPPTSRFWPPRNLPDGLYKDVVTARCKSQYYFYFTSVMYNICIVLQLILGAALTALGSISSKHGLAITILAAANTVNAGVVALLHNSGLPDRIRNDWNTYSAVEVSLIELLNTGVIQAAMPEKGDMVSNVIAYAFTLYTNANLTVQNNKPSSYVGSSGNATTTLSY